MNEQTDKYLDTLSKKVIKNTAVESPSFNFTASVMSQIDALEDSKVTTYQPLISKKAWAVISLSVVALVIYTIFGTQTESAGWLTSLHVDMLPTYDIKNPLADFHFSKTAAYACVLLVFMLLIQVSVLKKYMDKRFEN
ncbi:hypothetical protein [Confluentibacter sediminis]|uniref:hypothetical protein n=1 Tax=Confluentibacter sediminis TaxID=2219045 RepID=UPI000DAD430A|nr:hypothetical protein [Confluentibacter sediminis]